MRTSKVLVLAVLLGVGAILVAAPAMGVGFELLTVADSDGEEDGEDTGEATIGAQVSAFAQSSAEDANSSVDTGMWESALNASDDPESGVNNRTQALLERLERLEQRSGALEALYENGTIPEHVYEARASALQTQIANMEYAINHTETTAQNAGIGVNQTKLNDLRTQASNLTGPEVSAIARNITDAPRGPPADRGPPDHAGPDGDDDDGNQADSSPGNGPPDHAGPPENASENASDTTESISPVIDNENPAFSGSWMTSTRPGHQATEAF